MAIAVLFRDPYMGRGQAQHCVTGFELVKLDVDTLVGIKLDGTETEIAAYDFGRCAWSLIADEEQRYKEVTIG